MSLAEHPPGKPNGYIPWPDRQTFAQLAHSPRFKVPRPGRQDVVVHVDRVRAAPALSPNISMNLGIGAIGLGLWGFLFPRHVKKTLGVRAPSPLIQAVFGLRELFTGFTLAADPTRADMLWARVAGDAFDIFALKVLDQRRNPQRGAVRAALGFVVAITALDVITAFRMTNVERNCQEGRR
jgi:hypothetical protein